MKLELKHIAPYLPYGLKMQVNHSNLEYSVMTLCDKTGLSNIGISDVIDDIECFKPILRPLSDLEYDNDVIFTLYANCHDIDENIDYFSEFIVDITHSSMSYRASQILLKNHYDVFALIDKGLAIDINTI